MKLKEMKQITQIRKLLETNIREKNLMIDILIKSNRTEHKSKWLDHVNKQTSHIIQHRLVTGFF